MSQLVMPNSTKDSVVRRVFAVVGLVVLAASAVFGANPFGVRDRLLAVTPEARPAAVSRSATGPARLLPSQSAPTGGEATVVRSQPWWQGVATLEGSDTAATPAFTVDDGAIQWRVKSTCESGQLVVRTPGSRRPVVDAACPEEAIGYGTQKGPVSLDVTASGPWKLEVQQQIDLPLDEPPLPAMSAPGTRTVAAGSFYRVDQNGNGRVTIYRQADGRHALRLDDFFVSPNTDLEVLLSPLEAPHSTADIDQAPSVRVSFLDVTAGSMNFIVPPQIDPSQYRSVVIWCERLFSAYSAAALTPAP